MQNHAPYTTANRSTMLAERTVLTPTPRNIMAEKTSILVPATTLPSQDIHDLKRSH